MNSRAKGARGERELVTKLREMLGEVPGLRRCWHRAVNGGHDVDLPGWPVEVKRYKGIALHRWFEQAERQALKVGGRPLLAHREDRGEWLVTLRLTDWVALAREEMVALGAVEEQNRAQRDAGGDDGDR